MRSLKTTPVDHCPRVFSALSLAFTGLIVAVILSSLSLVLPGSAQGQFRERLRQRIQSRQNDSQTALSVGSQPAAQAVSVVAPSQASTAKIAGLDVAVWQPKGRGPFPLVIFSHGFHGRNTQSEFLMQAMAQAGYLVIAPNHRDAARIGSHADSQAGSPASSPASSHASSQESFRQPENWSDATYIDRRDDIAKLVSALHCDANFESLIDWKRIALAGHSLGGYTVLGLAGAWPSWKLPGVKAVVAMSPYCQPYLASGNLASLDLPVMYQGGTRDFGITPSVKKPAGAFAKTGAPAYFVEFDKMGHLGWTTFNHDKVKQDLITQYCLAFLDKYLKDQDSSVLKTKLPGVCDLRSK
jgi:dienelactone hydrolase